MSKLITTRDWDTRFPIKHVFFEFEACPRHIGMTIHLPSLETVVIPITPEKVVLITQVGTWYLMKVSAGQVLWLFLPGGEAIPLEDDTQFFPDDIPVVSTEQPSRRVRVR